MAAGNQKQGREKRACGETHSHVHHRAGGPCPCSRRTPRWRGCAHLQLRTSYTAKRPTVRACAGTPPPLSRRSECSALRLHLQPPGIRDTLQLRHFDLLTMQRLERWYTRHRRCGRRHGSGTGGGRRDRRRARTGRDACTQDSRGWMVMMWALTSAVGGIAGRLREKHRFSH